MSRIAGSLLAVVFLSGFTGCGGDEVEKPPLYPVKGTVTLNGTLLAGAAVTFHPKSGPTARGVTDEKGEFTLTTFDGGDGAVEGTHTVTVQKVEGGNAAPAAATPDPDKGGEVVVDTSTGPGADGTTEMEEPKSLVPVEFTTVLNTTLTFTVKTDGENEAKFDLTGTVN
ncbi:MAG: hypothetical protein O2856_13345 [Planctomycetota bacterium]|nr:hypothetical protein [Planctomycetota bacterium]